MNINIMTINNKIKYEYLINAQYSYTIIGNDIEVMNILY